MTAHDSRGYIQDVDDIDFASAVIDASFDRPIVVDFWAPWCAPCRTLGPILERLAATGRGAWSLAKVNVDQNQALSQRFNVQGIPAVKAFVNGSVVAEFNGAIPESQISPWLAGFVMTQPDETTVELDALAETDIDAALRSYAAVLSAQPTNDTARLGYARLLIVRNDSEAIPVLRQVTGPLKDQAIGWIHLAACAQEVYSANDDVAPIYVNALQAFFTNEHTRALSEMLALVIRARTWNDDAARKAYLAMLQALGTTHPIVALARNELAIALF